MRPRPPCPPRAALLALAGAALLAAPGCVTLGRSTAGTVPPLEEVASVRPGESVGEVLARLGAPLEASLAPDGLLLIWRERRHDYDRLGIDPSRLISVLALAQVAADALSNLKLTLERASLEEERVAVLFDREGRVLAVAHRDGAGRRLR